MPIYEYQYSPKKDPKGKYKGCDYCREPFEVNQKITDNPLTKCPKCKSPLEKIISKTSFKLGEKGKIGWADTGYETKK